MFLQAQNLRLPPNPNKGGDVFLSKSDLKEIAKHLINGKVPAKIMGVMAAPPSSALETPHVEQLREKLLTQYSDSVFRDEIYKDPQPRGRYGWAYIPLVPNPVPQRAKPWCMAGERGEAHKIVTQDWIDKGYIERPPTIAQPSNSPLGNSTRNCPTHCFNCEWLSQTFVVPKKSADFPWRGVVDLRGPNSQTRRVNYPLPRIEDLLVKAGGGPHFFHFGP